MTYFPELTVLPLRPQEFYKNPEEYRNCISALLEYLKENPQDTSALLLMIYYRWFNEEYAEAKAYLEQAEQSSPSAENIEAIETFRRGMIASGKISFEETPASQPEQSETRPDETASPAENEGPEPAEAG